MRTETETYTRNRGFCDVCRKPDKKIRIYKLISGIQISICDNCRHKKGTLEKGFCEFCRQSDKTVRRYKILGTAFHLCEECLNIKDPPRQKKKIPDPYKNEVPGNEAMALIQQGLADAKAGRTSKVEL